MTLEEIIKDYIDTQRPATREEMQHFEDEDTLPAVFLHLNGTLCV